MKNFLFILSIVVFSSCTSERKQVQNSDSAEDDIVADLSVENLPQKYKLVQMSSMMVNSETSGDDMPYQETYLLNEDMTFLKSRKQEGVTTSASGIFKKIVNDYGENLLIFTYTSDSNLIENCLNNYEERLRIVEDDNLNGTANACDHPSKLYEKDK